MRLSVLPGTVLEHRRVRASNAATILEPILALGCAVALAGWSKDKVTAPGALAEWAATSGSGGASVQCLAVKSTSLFAATLGGLFRIGDAPATGHESNRVERSECVRMPA